MLYVLLRELHFPRDISKLLKRFLFTCHLKYDSHDIPEEIRFLMTLTKKNQTESNKFDSCIAERVHDVQNTH